MNQKKNNKYLINNYQSNSDSIIVLQSEKKSRWLFSIIHKLIPFFMIWLSLVLMFGVICMYTNAMGQDEFYRFIFFLRNPIVVTVNCLALLVALLHSIQWFNSVTKALSLNLYNQKKLALLVTTCMWIMTVGGSIFFLLLVLK